MEVVAQKIQYGPSVAHLPEQAQARGQAGIVELLLAGELGPLPLVEAHLGAQAGRRQVGGGCQAGIRGEQLAQQLGKLAQQSGPARGHVAQLLVEAD